MVEYSTFTPPQAIDFNRPCSAKRQIARKITSHIIHNFMGVLVPKLWEGDLKLHSRFVFQFESSLSFFTAITYRTWSDLLCEALWKIWDYFFLIETADT